MMTNNIKVNTTDSKTYPKQEDIAPIKSSNDSNDKVDYETKMSADTNFHSQISEFDNEQNKDTSNDDIELEAPHKALNPPIGLKRLAEMFKILKNDSEETEEKMSPRQPQSSNLLQKNATVENKIDLQSRRSQISDISSYSQTTDSSDDKLSLDNQYHSDYPQHKYNTNLSENPYTGSNSSSSMYKHYSPEYARYFPRPHYQTPELSNPTAVSQLENNTSNLQKNHTYWQNTVRSMNSAHQSVRNMTSNRPINSRDYNDPNFSSGQIYLPAWSNGNPINHENALSKSSLNNELPYSGRYRYVYPFPDTYRYTNHNVVSPVRYWNMYTSQTNNDQERDDQLNPLLELPKQEFTGWAGNKWPTVLKAPPKPPDPEEENMRVYTKPCTSHNRTYCFEFIKGALKKYINRIKLLMYKHFPDGFHVKSGHLEYKTDEGKPSAPVSEEPFSIEGANQFDNECQLDEQTELGINTT